MTCFVCLLLRCVHDDEKFLEFFSVSDVSNIEEFSCSNKPMSIDISGLLRKVSKMSNSKIYFKKIIWTGTSHLLEVFSGLALLLCNSDILDDKYVNRLYGLVWDLTVLIHDNELEKETIDALSYFLQRLFLSGYGNGLSTPKRIKLMVQRINLSKHWQDIYLELFESVDEIYKMGIMIDFLPLLSTPDMCRLFPIFDSPSADATICAQLYYSIITSNRMVDRTISNNISLVILTNSSFAEDIIHRLLSNFMKSNFLNDLSTDKFKANIAKFFVQHLTRLVMCEDEYQLKLKDAHNVLACLKGCHKLISTRPSELCSLSQELAATLLYNLEDFQLKDFVELKRFCLIDLVAYDPIRACAKGATKLNDMVDEMPKFSLPVKGFQLVKNNIEIIHQNEADETKHYVPSLKATIRSNMAKVVHLTLESMPGAYHQLVDHRNSFSEHVDGFSTSIPSKMQYKRMCYI
ncbi:hypothetical protein RF11_01449 [Thelohanellus kitauei]|uniref:Telomere length regulation protein conserved domain-containing protein n=1 Tax=Thelohanellus kitauei TaxID=669202 RepID=A0A0C2MP97_THEKT|nr:hypothetical protein RF11_01449 [Thelohanellus kitauei]